MIMNITTNYIRAIIWFDEAFKYGDYVKFWRYVGTNAEPLCRIL
jgi:hypothetical protein